MTVLKNSPFITAFIAKVKSLNYGNIVAYLALGFISYQFVYPLLRMISLSLMSEADIISPSVNWIPQSLAFGNLRTAWRVMDPSNTMVNSTLFSGTLAFGQTFVAATAGFAFARYKFPLKNFWFFMAIVAFVLPTPILLIPRTMMMAEFQRVLDFQLFGTVWPQIGMAFLGQGVFSTILMLIFYHFTNMIPPALDEAAYIDGANSVQIFYHIILKLSLPTLLVIFLFAFVWNWNETYVTSIFLRGGLELAPGRLQNFAHLFGNYAEISDLLEIGAFGADEFMTDAQRINEAFRMSGTLIAISPLFILYLVVQRQFIKGIENTGFTGI